MEVFLQKQKNREEIGYGITLLLVWKQHGKEQNSLLIILKTEDLDTIYPID
jgi:hypothetical protein